MNAVKATASQKIQVLQREKKKILDNIKLMVTLEEFGLIVRE